MLRSDASMARKATFTYWTDLRSANPNPVCRIGGCGESAVDGSEFCAGHDLAVALDRDRAAEVKAFLGCRAARGLTAL